MGRNETVTVITSQGAKTTGPMPERDADIIQALAEITGNIADRKKGQ